MPRLRTISNIVLRRNVKSIQKLDVEALALSSSLQYKFIEPEDVAQAIDVLKEAASGLKPKLLTLKNPRGFFETFITPTYNTTDKSAVSECTFKFILAMFVCKTLESEIDNLRVIDYLGGTASALNAASGNENAFAFSSAFKQPDAVTNLLKSYKNFMTYFETPYLKVDQSVLKGINDFIDAFTELANVSDKFMAYTAPFLTLVMAAEHTKFCRQLFSTKFFESSVKNADSYELPEYLDNTNVDDFVNTVLSMQIINRRLEKLALQVTDSDGLSLIGYNKEAGQWTFTENFTVRLLEEFTLKFIFEFLEERKELHDLRKAMSKLSDYSTRRALFSSCHDGERLSANDHLLFVLFGSHSTKMTLDTTSTTEELNLLSTKFGAQFGKICDLISQYYKTPSFADVCSFEAHTWVDRRRQRIARLNYKKPVVDPQVLELDFACPNEKSLSSLTKKYFQMNTIGFEQNESFPKLADLALQSKLTNESARLEVTDCGAIVADFDSSVRQVIHKMSTFFEITYLDESHDYECTERTGLYTIYPPAIGPDVLTFGTADNARTSGTTEYKLSYIDARTCDILSLATSFFGVNITSQSQEGLRDMYEKVMNRFVTRERQYLRDVTYSPYTMFEMSNQFMANFMRLLGSTDTNLLPMLKRVFFLPANTSIKTLRSAMLPKFVALPTQVSFKMVVPENALSSQAIEDVRVNTAINGPLVRDTGKPTFTLTKVADNAVDQSLKNLFGDIQFYEVNFYLDLRDSVTFVMGQLPFKAPEKISLNHSLGAVKNCATLIARVDYGLADLNAAVKSKMVSLVNRDGPMSMSKIFRDVRGLHPADSFVTNANRYCINLCNDAFILCHSALGLSTVTHVDKGVVYNEIKYFVEHLTSSYHKDTRLRIIGGFSPYTVGEIEDCFKTITKAITEDSKVDPNKLTAEQFAELSRKLSDEDISRTFALHLDVPQAITSRSSGVLKSLFEEGKVNYLPLPRVVTSVSVAGLSDKIGGYYMDFINAALVNYVNSFCFVS